MYNIQSLKKMSDFDKYSGDFEITGYQNGVIKFCGWSILQRIASITQYASPEERLILERITKDFMNREIERVAAEDASNEKRAEAYAAHLNKHAGSTGPVWKYRKNAVNGKWVVYTEVSHPVPSDF